MAMASNKQDFDILPDEILMHIFKYLTVDTLLTCETVCQRWKRIARDSSVWRSRLITYSEKPGDTDLNKRCLHLLMPTHSKNIFQLKVQYVSDYQRILLILMECTNLISLELVMCRIDKYFEKYIERLSNLRKISLKNSLLLRLDVDTLINYDRFKHLYFLELSNFGLNTSNCDTLLRCDYLSHIFIEKIQSLTAEFIRQLILSKRDILKCFHFYGGDAVNDSILRLFAQCPMLKDLAIIRCEGLTDIGLITLADMERIEDLQIWNNAKFTEECLLKTLGSPNLINLKSLSLSRIENITPKVLDVILEQCKDITYLSLYECHKVINVDNERQLRFKSRNINVVLY